MDCVCMYVCGMCDKCMYVCDGAFVRCECVIGVYVYGEYIRVMDICNGCIVIGICMCDGICMCMMGVTCMCMRCIWV
jgi:hypothetical protein